MNLATYLDLMVSDPPQAHIYSDLIYDTIINITSQDDGVFISLKMLPIVKRLSDEVFESYNHDIYIRLTIDFINKLTIQYYNSNLTEWVNNLNWTDGCVPYYFAEYSDSLGYDTTNWVACS